MWLGFFCRVFWWKFICCHTFLSDVLAEQYFLLSVSCRLSLFFWSGSDLKLPNWNARLEPSDDIYQTCSLLNAFEISMNHHESMIVLGHEGSHTNRVRITNHNRQFNNSTTSPLRFGPTFRTSKCTWLPWFWVANQTFRLGLFRFNAYDRYRSAWRSTTYGYPSGWCAKRLWPRNRDLVGQLVVVDVAFVGVCKKTCQFEMSGYF